MARSGPKGANYSKRTRGASRTATPPAATCSSRFPAPLKARNPRRPQLPLITWGAYSSRPTTGRVENMKRLAMAACLVLIALPTLAPAEDQPASPVVKHEGEPPVISLYDLIERVSKKTGKRFVIDPRVHGSAALSGLDLNRIDYETLLAILRVND